MREDQLSDTRKPRLPRAYFGECDVELSLERAPLHGDDLVESTAQ